MQVIDGINPLLKSKNCIIKHFTNDRNYMIKTIVANSEITVKVTFLSHIVAKTKAFTFIRDFFFLMGKKNTTFFLNCHLVQQ